MKAKQIISLILAFCLFCGLSSAFAAGSAGSASDPLISKSYIDNTYPAIVLASPIELIKNSMTVLEYKLSQKTSGISYITVPSGKGLTASSGASFTLLSGTATLTSLSGTLIDVTDGVTISAGLALKENHRYVAGANTTAAISSSASAKFSALGSVALGSVSMSFTDVPATAWFYNYVSYAYVNGLINGKSETVFAPEEYLKINEAIKLAACMHQLYTTGAVSLVNGTATWYSTFLEYAVNSGIVTKTYTNYDAYITRSEFVNIFYSALPGSEYTAMNSVADNAIPDVKSTDPYAQMIYAFYRAGILNGKDDKGSFWPDQNIFRSEVATIMARMFEKNQRVPITLQ